MNTAGHHASEGNKSKGVVASSYFSSNSGLDLILASALTLPKSLWPDAVIIAQIRISQPPAHTFSLYSVTYMWWWCGLLKIDVKLPVVFRNTSTT